MAKTQNQETLEVNFLYPPTDIKQPVAIYNDGGGLVDKYIAQAHQYALEGRRVEIRGSCRSACTLALSVPSVCVSPGAQVKMHQAYELYSGKERPDITDKMLNELPANIRQRLEGHISRDYSSEATLNYSDLRSLGVPDCDGKKDHRQTKGVKLKILNPFDAVFRFFGDI